MLIQPLEMTNSDHISVHNTAFAVARHDPASPTTIVLTSDILRRYEMNIARFEPWTLINLLHRDLDRFTGRRYGAPGSDEVSSTVADWVPLAFSELRSSLCSCLQNISRHQMGSNSSSAGHVSTCAICVASSSDSRRLILTPSAVR